MGERGHASLSSPVDAAAALPDCVHEYLRHVRVEKRLAERTLVLYTLDLIKLCGFAAEAGAYEWRSDDLNSASIFAGDGIVSSLIKQSWERFKFGGQPGGQQ